ncbi:MAG TPA: DNA primase [Micromonosporaceae bacterium]
MARQPSHRPDTESSQRDRDPDAPATRADRSLWEEVRVDPVEIALPAGSGFTLRAYRPSTKVTPTDVEDRDADDIFASRAAAATAEVDDETVVILDEEFAEQLEAEEETTEVRRRRRRAEGEGDLAVEAESDEELAADEESEEEADEEAEEVPVFLSHRGRVLLFRSPESLVDFVRSDAPNDLAQVDTYRTLADRIQPADIAPLDDDTYELDLIVENLRGGHDVWDPALLIRGGEVARDLAYALRLPAVLDMLGPGSSLDDLDEALRSTAGGGLGAFRGRRRLRKIGAQTASLGWRTIIGKISAAVDWRD